MPSAFVVSDVFPSQPICSSKRMSQMAADQPVTPVPRAERIASIDVFRGLTMLVMLFVNDINDYGVKYAAWLLYHMDEISVKRLYRVDEPSGERATADRDRRRHAADRARQAADDGQDRLHDGAGRDLSHLSVHRRPVDSGRTGAADRSRRLDAQTQRARRAALVRDDRNRAVHVEYAQCRPVNGMSPDLWRLLLFPSMILLWNRYPSMRGVWRWLFVVLRLCGAGLLIYLLVIFRRDDNAWLSPGWWGIIGLIGWAYLLAALVWLVARDLGVAIMGALALLVAFRLCNDLLVLYHADGNAIGLSQWWPSTFHGWLINPGSLAGLATPVFGGMAIATLFRPDSPARTPRSRIAWILVFAAGFAAAAFLLRPVLWPGHQQGSRHACLLPLLHGHRLCGLRVSLLAGRRDEDQPLDGARRSGRLEHALDVHAPLDLCRSRWPCSGSTIPRLHLSLSSRGSRVRCISTRAGWESAGRP